VADRSRFDHDASSQVLYDSCQSQTIVAEEEEDLYSEIDGAQLVAAGTVAAVLVHSLPMAALMIADAAAVVVAAAAAHEFFVLVAAVVVVVVAAAEYCY